ncbi:MAG: hypothetical protein M1368_11345 [Thaumarchaeota archaeon]|nr:hypothetical protein [Nitrososphaerota archaeon]
MHSDTILYKKIRNIDHVKETIVLDNVAQMLSEILVVKEKFRLDVLQESVRADINGILDEVWVILEELRPEQLEGYGNLSVDDGELIEFHITRLLDKLKGISESLKLTSG